MPFKSKAHQAAVMLALQRGNILGKAINEGTHKPAIDWLHQLFGRSYHKSPQVARHVDRAVNRMKRAGIDVVGQPFAFHEVERYLVPGMSGRHPLNDPRRDEWADHMRVQTGRKPRKIR